MRWILTVVFAFFTSSIFAQESLTPEKLEQLGRVSPMGLSRDKQWVIYKVSTPDVAENRLSSKLYKISISGGAPDEISSATDLITDDRVSPDGQYRMSSAVVKLEHTRGVDDYPALTQSNVYIYNSLNYRQWDTWSKGEFNHVFISTVAQQGAPKDIMPGERFDCPQKPLGGNEDFIWSPDSKKVVYVCKKKSGTAYAVSTNTDLYAYDIASGTTRDITKGLNGYDINPAFSSTGTLGWISMKRDGFESDKQDIVIADGQHMINLTQQRDDIHVRAFRWSNDGRSLFFIAPVNGTWQLFTVNNLLATGGKPMVNQITRGDFDIYGIIGQSGNTLIVSRTDINHALEIFTLNLKSAELKQLTHVNDELYRQIAPCKVVRRFVHTTDDRQMLEWVVYPPGFIPTKKYPVLLYCQGGPQSSLTLQYSFRSNLQLFASQGYIVLAPNRRGMPGYGTQWNEEVSKDWAGHATTDFLNAIDDITKEPYVDNTRLACLGFSFGGFSVYELEAIHQHRFKTFIAQDGIFDFRSMYGTADEAWLVNWEYGGAYWEKDNAVAQRSFGQSPSNFVNQWDTPILIIHNGKDFRVPVEQGLQAFQAAQLHRLKSRFIYLPEENHFAQGIQNTLVYQHEIFKWLAETL